MPSQGVPLAHGKARRSPVDAPTAMPLAERLVTNPVPWARSTLPAASTCASRREELTGQTHEGPIAKLSRLHVASCAGVTATLWELVPISEARQPRRDRPAYRRAISADGTQSLSGPAHDASRPTPSQNDGVAAAAAGGTAAVATTVVAGSGGAGRESG